MNTLQYILVDLGGPGYAFQSCPVSLWTHQAPRNQRLILGSTVAWVEKDGAHGRPSVDVDVGLPSPMCLRLIGFFFWNVKPLRNKTNKKGKTTRPQNSRTCTPFLDTAEEPSTKQLRQSTSFVTTSRTSSLWIQLTFPTWMGHGCIHCLSQYGFANNPLVSICSRSLSYTILKSWNLLYVFFWSWITRVAEIRHPRSWI